MAETLTTTTDELARAVLSTASANDLPDSAFAYIEPGGEKDEEGKTKPRSLRHLPYKNADGKVDPAHVRNALARLSQTQIPESAKASAHKKLVAAAKSVGIEVSDDDAQERSMNKTEEALTRAAAANHEPMTGSHSHTHPAFGAQGDDDTHEHEHEHSNDADHHHAHNTERSVESFPGLQMYMPITRTDKDEWVIEGQATSEALDSYGTVFEYESSKKAFQRWMERGNIREQHDPRKAVGKALAVEFDDANKAIFVRARISKGARDTWEKILDGTLSGFSVGMRSDAKMRHIERAGKHVPMYYDTTLSELSVVDSPGSPQCDIAISRADGIISDVIDNADEQTTAPTESAEQKPVERAGTRVSSDTRDAMHKGIAHTMHAAVAQMQNCGCDSCMKAQKMIDPDGDGDIDIGSFDDPDGDANDLYNGRDADMSRSLESLVERILEKNLSAVYARLQGIAGTLARSNAAPTPLPIESILTSAITRAVEAANAANESSLSEVRAEVSAVKATVDKIADTPVPGAPVMNAGALPRPVDKRLATDPYQAPARSGSAVYDALSRMSESGQLDTPERQADAVAAGFMAQRFGR